MVEFAHILGEVERRLSPDAADSAADFAPHDDAYLALLEINNLDSAATCEPTGARSRLANALYASSESVEPSPCHEEKVAQRKFKLSASELRRLILRLNNPALSLQDLRTLRREFAWRFHPDRLALEDRGEADSAMAQLNSRIDELIQGKASCSAKQA